MDTGAKRSYVHYQPLGAVLAVMPWNYPFWQVIRASTPALMAGNVMLLKHASNVPQCALMIEDLYRRAGFPEGVFQTLLIGSQQVDAVLNDPRIKAATLTGSEGAGVQVGMGAAKRVKKVVLELGGSDPFIVMPSANMDQAVAAAVKARITNNGQSCINSKRFIVAAPIADEFERRFVKAMESLRVGDPFDEQTEVGPLATKDAVKDIDSGVQETVSAGARLLTGGRPLDRPGYFYPPTVMSNVPKNSPGYARNSLVRWPACFAPTTSMTPFASPTIRDSAWARASGPTTIASATASSTTSNREWCSSIKSWPRTHGCPLAASSGRDMGANWACMASGSSPTLRRSGLNSPGIGIVPLSTL